MKRTRHRQHFRSILVRLVENGTVPALSRSRRPSRNSTSLAAPPDRARRRHCNGPFSGSTWMSMFPPHARRENALAKRCATAAGPRCTGSCMQCRERTKNLSIGSRIIDLRVMKFFLPMFLVMFSPFRVQEASANRPVNLSTRSCVAQLRVDFARISPLGILVRQSVYKKRNGLWVGLSVCV